MKNKNKYYKFTLYIKENNIENINNIKNYSLSNIFNIMYFYTRIIFFYIWINKRINKLRKKYKIKLYFFYIKKGYNNIN